MNGFWEFSQELEKEYHTYRKVIMEEYELSAMEVDVLLFLANNAECDTATDIVRIQRRSKSHVSLAVRGLMQKGYLSGITDTSDRKKIRLKIMSEAEKIVHFGREQQKKFVDSIFNGFTEQEKEAYFSFCRRIQENAHKRRDERGQE